METPDLALLEHENWIAYLAASVSLNPDGLFLRDRGIVTLLGGVSMHFFNQIMVERSEAATSAMRDAVATGRGRRAPFVVSLREGLDDRFARTMGELGLVAADGATTRAMTLYPLHQRSTPAEAEAGFAIRRVADEPELADHRRIVTVGFGSDASVAEAMLGTGLLDRPECAVYVGYVNGKPVTSGLGWRTGRTIGVYNIATIPEARRRGFGEAMTARVLADGEAAGCDVAILQASSMGGPIYERLGFRTALRYTGYVDQAQLGG